jgi:DNA-binding CsgD family transcriptional regulator
MGIFLFLLNCFLFYWHISTLASSAAEAELRRLIAETQEATAVSQPGANSNWSRKAGLSEAFVAKYGLSAQERRALELAILGKVDKEIAVDMGIALSTVKSYMHRVYVKTDTYGRGGVFSLIHGGK